MAIKIPIKTDFAGWYQEVVYTAELADLSPVRGCIVIRPYGYALWENIQANVDARIKKTGHQNAYFPLFIPESFLKKEAKHVEGFAPEVTVVTYAGGKELEERLIVRPTSETMIHYMFAKWIKSYRDLPLKINQWANVVRWEMRTRPFLRTTEFLWQEGHTVHETLKEAEEETLLMLNEYVDFIENHLAIPVVKAKKSENEKFAGADVTWTMEGLMQDGKALQMGTSHLLSQNFAKSFEIIFQDREGKMAYPYLTSWAVTTRLIGAIVMVHGDQKGLILPPKIAPIQIVIIPIMKSSAADCTLGAVVERLANELSSKFRVKIDKDDQMSPGAKFYHWEMKGVPLRLEIGPRDLQQNQAILVDRVSGTKDAVNLNDLEEVVASKLELIQKMLFNRALEYRKNLWFKQAKLVDFADSLESVGGFYQTGWCKRDECEAVAKQAKATIRCILNEKEFSTCFNCTRESTEDILVAKSY